MIVAKAPMLSQLCPSALPSRWQQDPTLDCGHASHGHVINAAAGVHQQQRCSIGARHAAKHHVRLRTRALQAAALRQAPAALAHVSQAPHAKTFDVVHLGNLCLDIIVHVDQLPPDDVALRAELLAELTATPPDQSSWEVGGASNFMIAAARLGLRVGSLGQLGHDVYGEFFRNIMQEEGVRVIQPLLPPEMQPDPTLLCFVLVRPDSAHTFCSRYDFGPWPLLAGIRNLQPSVLEVLRDTRALMINGFVFDELPADLIVQAALQTRSAGGSVFFDPGPRSWTLLQGERRAALDALLDVADVVLMTQEEAAAVTGESDAAAAGAWVLGRPGTATSWAVIKQGADGALLCARGAAAPVHIEALSVPVKDTVGCGDSFAAAVALGFTRAHNPEATLALANAVGAATAMGRGAGRSVADAQTVTSLLTAQLQGGTMPPSNSSSDGSSQTAVASPTTSASTAANGDSTSDASSGGGTDPPLNSPHAGSAEEFDHLLRSDSPSERALELLRQSLDEADAAL